MPKATKASKFPSLMLLRKYRKFLETYLYSGSSDEKAIAYSEMRIAASKDVIRVLTPVDICSAFSLSKEGKWNGLLDVGSSKRLLKLAEMNDLKIFQDESKKAVSASTKAQPSGKESLDVKDDESSEESDEKPQPKKSKIIVSNAVKPSVKAVKSESSSESSDEESSDDNSDKKPSKTQKPSKASKQSSSDMESEDESSEGEDDGASSMTPSKKPSKASKQNCSDMESEDESSEGEDDGASSMTPSKKPSKASKQSSSDMESEDESSEGEDDGASSMTPRKRPSKASKQSSCDMESEDESSEGEDDGASSMTPTKKDETKKAVQEAQPSKKADESFDYSVELIPKKPGASKRLLVRNLSDSIKRADVEDFFKGAGKVVDVFFSVDKNGVFNGFAYVRFANSEAVEKARRLNGEPLLHRKVDISLAIDRKKGISFWDSGSGTDQSLKVYVRGFDKKLGEHRIRSVLKAQFGICGKISSIEIPHYYSSLERSTLPKGFAFVEFKDPDGFNKALTLNGVRHSGTGYNWVWVVQRQEPLHG